MDARVYGTNWSIRSWLLSERVHNRCPEIDIPFPQTRSKSNSPPPRHQSSHSHTLAPVPVSWVDSGICTPCHWCQNTRWHSDNLHLQICLKQAPTYSVRIDSLARIAWSANASLICVNVNYVNWPEWKQFVKNKDSIKRNRGSYCVQSKEWKQRLVV